jgi:hypothetical protein
MRKNRMLEAALPGSQTNYIFIHNEEAFQSKAKLKWHALIRAVQGRVYF